LCLSATTNIVRIALQLFRKYIYVYNVRIVDRVGSGDSFASGLIYGLVTGMPMPEAAEFGVAASAIKHTIPGDLNHATLGEVKDLMKGDGSGRVQR
jgi:2-dehydro-3-deoxygluconokinase